MKRQHVLLSIVALGVLCASVIMVFGGFAPLQHAKAAAAATPTATDFSINGGSDPWGTAFDSSGRVWVAVPGCDPNPVCNTNAAPGRLDVYDPHTSSWTASHQLPGGFGQALFIAFDKQGRAWFPMFMTNSLGMYDPGTNTFSQWVVPTANSGPWDVAVDSKGIVWFTEHYTNKIGSFNPATNTFKEVATPAAASQPYGIIIDKSDNIWFTENNQAVALIAEYTTGGVLNEYKIRNSFVNGLTPHKITIDFNGDIWWSEGWVMKIGKLSLAQASPGTNNGVTEYGYQNLCSSCGAHTSGITADTNGYVWFTDALQGTYGYFNISGVGSPSVFKTPSGGHPHDGIHADANNTIWFTEEFAYKLGSITGGPTGGNNGGTPTATPTTAPTATPTPPPVYGSTLAQDTFQRANQSFWGNASDGQTWGGDANTSSVFSVANNTGLVTNNNLSYSAVLGPVATDAEILLTGSISNFSGDNFGGVLRFTDGNNWYKAYIDGNNLVLQKKLNGSASVITTVPFTAQANTSYSIRFRIVGSALSAKVWASSGSEPGSWMITATDTSLTSGQGGMRVLSPGATTTISSFIETSLSGVSATPTPSVTPTPGITPTPSVTPTATTVPTTTPTSVPTVTPTSTGGSTLGQDTFQRANQSFWGNASDGQTWGGDANATSAFSVASNAGLVTNGGMSYSAVLGPVATNAQVLLSGSMSSFGNDNFGGVLRFTDGNNWYKAYIDGTNLVLQKKVNGVASILTTVPFSAQGNTQYSIRFQVVGSTLSAKVWASSGSEPGGWMATTTDTSLTSGQCGLRVLSPGATLTMVSFMATTI